MKDATLFSYVRLSLAALVGSILIGAAAAAWGWYALQQARAAHQTAVAQRADIQGRLSRANLEQQELRDKIGRFKQLEAHGVIGSERRLDWIEQMSEIRKVRRLSDLQYELSPQHPVDKLWLPGGAVAAGLRFEASTLTLTASLLHEGDLIGLLDDIRLRVPAYTLPKRCVVSRTVKPGSIGGATLDTVCELDWITLQGPT